MPLIRDVVAHAEPRLAALGKEVNFTLTTNATLLNEDLVDWLDAHRFGLTVSMDGPRALHDLNRKTVGGKGSYDAVAAKARMLLSRYKSRPVGARVTLTAGVTAVEEIWDHLKHAIGFAEVGFSPVTSGDVDKGIEKDRLSGFLESRLDRTDKGCATCRIRNLCSGGCYHESYAHFSDPLKPAYHYCDLMRDWVDFGIEVYGDLIATNPAYFHDHIAPRKANHK